MKTDKCLSNMSTSTKTLKKMELDENQWKKITPDFGC